MFRKIFEQEIQIQPLSFGGNTRNGERPGINIIGDYLLRIRTRRGHSGNTATTPNVQNFPAGEDIALIEHHTREAYARCPWIRPERCRQVLTGQLFCGFPYLDERRALECQDFRTKRNGRQRRVFVEETFEEGVGGWLDEHFLRTLTLTLTLTFTWTVAVHTRRYDISF
jgi:hypothetical protein